MQQQHGEDIFISSSILQYNENTDVTGSGGTCTVFKAKLNGEDVAIKKLKTVGTMAITNEQKACMTREIRCLRNLWHQNVIIFRSAILEKDCIAYVMEYMSKGDIRNFIHEQFVHPHVKVKLLHDVSQGVNYLHCLPKQIIHNDLKAANVLISDQIVAKLTDFGLAYRQLNTMSKIYVEEQNERSKGATNTHRAPERWMNIDCCSTKSDVYSFAILMWEVFSEEMPFANCSNDDDIERTVCKQNSRPDLSQVEGSTYPEVIDIMKACWHPEPYQRPEMSSVMSDLHELVSRPDAKIKMKKCFEQTVVSIGNDNKVSNKIY